MKKVLIIFGIFIVLSFIPLFNGTFSVYTGACTNPECSNGPFVSKVSFWEYMVVKFLN